MFSEKKLPQILRKNSKIGFFEVILLGLYRLYKITLSPLIGNQCRYLPTCSDYASECVKRHGAYKGVFMGLARVCRCHPNSPRGFDPPPEIAQQTKWFTPWKYGIWNVKTDENGFVCNENLDEKNK